MYMYLQVYNHSLSLSLSLSLSHSLSLQSTCTQSPSSVVAEDLPRIAQLQNEVEKRDKALLQFKKENEALRVRYTVITGV